MMTMRTLRTALGSVSEAVMGPLLPALLRLTQDARVWVVMATVAAQGSAFLVSMLITRTHGMAALGLYSATLNVAAIFSRPFTSMLEYNGAILSAARPTARAALLRAHAPALLLLMAGGLVGFALLAPRSGLPDVWDSAHWLMWIAAACVLFNQLQSSVTQGLLQGIGVFVRTAQWRLMMTLCIAATAVPLIGSAGLHGAYVVLALNSITPPLIMIWIYLHPEDGQRPRAAPASEPPSVRLVTRAHLASLSSVAAAVFDASIAWFCLVFLVNKSHGADGLGWISLGLQWATLMLLPVTSWGGVTLKLLIDTKHTGCPSAVRRVTNNQIVQNAGITLLVAMAIVVASPALAAIYHVQASLLWPILAVCGLWAVLAAANNVFERLFFCMDKQATWMGLSLLSGLVQMLVTYLTVPSTVLGVVFGLCAGSLTLLLGSWFCRHHVLSAIGKAR
jgi:O-antigen/teichoic acid export membrane protein